MNEQFYQTTEFYNAVAIGTLIIIFLVLFFFGNIFKAARYFKTTRERKMSTDFIFLKVLIQCSETIEQLQKFEADSEKYFDKYHLKESDNKELQAYYSRLLADISRKEKQLYGIGKAAV